MSYDLNLDDGYVDAWHEGRDADGVCADCGASTYEDRTDDGWRFWCPDCADHRDDAPCCPRCDERQAPGHCECIDAALLAEPG